MVNRERETYWMLPKAERVATLVPYVLAEIQALL